jgi:hypothetical protein
MKPVAVMLLLTLVACGETTGPTDAATGTWILTTVSGSPVPYRDTSFHCTPGYCNLLSSTIVARDGRFTVNDSDEYFGLDPARVIQAGDSASGTYQLSGNTVVFHFTANDMEWTGTVVGSTLPLAGDFPYGRDWVYTRRER